MIIPTAFLFLLGLIVGSFLNVLGIRFNSGSTLGGRSFCVVCRKSLHWWELVPVISFVGLRGKCSECKTKISWQYPIVELWTGLIFATVPLLTIPVFCIFVVITIYDFRHKIIPDTLVYSAILLSVLFRAYSGGNLFDWLAGPILFIFFASVWFLSKGRAMGFGDAKLALAIGLLLGAPMGFSAFVLAFWIGTVITLSFMLLARLKVALFKKGKKLTMKSEIPFAPFLIIGAWASLILHSDLFHVLVFIKK